MGNTTGKAGKFRDPVFVSMVLAMVLAVGSSIALRAVVHNAGPAAAQAAEPGDDAPHDGLPPLPKMPTPNPSK